MSTAPFLLAAASVRTLREIRDGHDFDGIDAHYFYPAGVAAALLGRRFGRPVVITARGSDINRIARHAIPRRLIVWAARRAGAVVTGSESLKSATEQLGVDPARIFVGQLPQSELPRYYSAADALVLASSGEGWPNVLLEAMAARPWSRRGSAARPRWSPRERPTCSSSRGRWRPWEPRFGSCSRVHRAVPRRAATRKASAGMRPREGSKPCSSG
jgi:hypothetical protein